MPKTILFGALFSVVAGALPCPEKIKYSTGNYLKLGDYYYYSTGNGLIRGGHIYYPTGGFLKRDNNVFYPNGGYLQRDQNLYYPNGGALKRGDDYLYANGNYLKRDANFYYENGNIARRNGVLYRQDGTVTVFPITLIERIGSYGDVIAEVKAESERVVVDFHDLLVQGAGAHLSALWNESQFAYFQLRLNTGVPGEDVFVRAGDGGIVCSLQPENPFPTIFELYGTAATVEVRTKPGFDPVEIRKVLQTALDSLAPSAK